MSLFIGISMDHRAQDPALDPFTWLGCALWFSYFPQIGELLLMVVRLTFLCLLEIYVLWCGLFGVM